MDFYRKADERLVPMERVILAEGPFYVSRLGFGCAGLMGRIDRVRSVRLLHAAYEAGITHFDTARSYGYGEAEIALGEFAAAVGRKNITIATKLGIMPPLRTPVLASLKRAARLVARTMPMTRHLLRRGARRMVRAGAFDVPTATASLEASLTALRTDHIDLLLLHECSLGDLTDELFGFLDRMRRNGKLLHHGIATLPDQTNAILRSRPAFAPIVQVAGSLWEPLNRIPALTERGGPPVVTHSALGARVGELRSRLSADSSFARVWSEALGYDVVQNWSRLAGACLAAAVADNPKGAVLFSSTSEGNIHANVAAAGSGQAVADLAPTLATLEHLAKAGGVSPSPAKTREHFEARSR